MEQGIIDIRNKAKAMSKKFSEFNFYPISCMTLLKIIDELEKAEQKIIKLEKAKGE